VIHAAVEGHGFQGFRVCFARNLTLSATCQARTAPLPPEAPLIGPQKDFAYAPGTENWDRNVGKHVSSSSTTVDEPTGHQRYPSSSTFLRERPLSQGNTPRPMRSLKVLTFLPFFCFSAFLAELASAF
jgi:hypothetical protein